MNNMKSLCSRVSLVLALLISVSACGPHATVDTKAIIHPAVVVDNGSGGINTGNGGGGGACNASCANRACGSDGCGGVCGTGCASNQICSGFQCQASTIPDQTYCPAEQEYCHKLDDMELQCFKLTGKASSLKCNTQLGNFDYMSPIDKVSHPYRNGAAVLQCQSPAGATHWMLRPKGQHNQIGQDSDYEDWSCELVSQPNPGNIGGGSKPLGAGDIACYAERVDSTNWQSLSGSGLSSAAVGDSTKAFDSYTFWGNATNNRVNFTVYAGQPGFCILPRLSDKLWAYGGVEGKVGDQVVATFRVVCGGTQTFLYENTTPKCPSNSLDSVGKPCLFSNSPQNDDRRFCGRNR